MSITNNIYNILSKLNSLTESAKPAATTETVYESVEARGSISEAVKSLESKFAIFKEAKPDFLDLDKDGDKKEPMKKAAADKKAGGDHKSAKKGMSDKQAKYFGKKEVAEGAGPYTLDDPKHPKFKANYEKYKKAHPDCTLAEFVAAMRKKEKSLSEAAYDEPEAPNADAIAKRKRLQALKDRQEDERDSYSDTKSNVRKVAGKAYGGAAQPDEPNEFEKGNFVQRKKSINLGPNDDLDEVAPPGAKAERMVKHIKKGYAKDGALTKKEKGIAYATAWKAKKAGQVEEGFMDAVKSAGQKLNTAAGTAARKIGIDPANIGAKVDSGVASVRQTKANITKNPADVQKAKAASLKAADSRTFASGRSDPRVAGHRSDAISWDYRDDVKEVSDKTVGSLLQKRKDNEASANKGSDSSAAFDATGKRTDAYGASIARNKRLGRDAYAHPQANEGVEFKDAGKIKNSAPNMKKAKPAMVKESRVMEETDYFYEKVAKSLCRKNPNLDTAGGEFVDAVRKEMIAQGIEPNRARNIIMMDEDFLGDVATSYGYYCKEMQPEGVLPNAPLDDSARELDEIANLAGLTVPAAPAAPVMDEAQGVNVNGKEINIGSIEVEGVHSWDSPDFADAYITYAEFMDGSPLSDDELVQLEQEHGDLVNQAAHDSLQGSGDFLDEDDVAEGNEFSGALAAAKAKGEKEFEVDGKRYTVKEDINVSINATGQEDALNLFRKLAGMAEVAVQPKAHTASEPQDLESALAQGVIEPVEEERDIEYVNTPNEKIAPISASIPSGTDLHRSKMQDPETANRAANPLARKEKQVEENLWKSYESMLADVKSK